MKIPKSALKLFKVGDSIKFESKIDNENRAGSSGEKELVVNKNKQQVKVV